VYRSPIILALTAIVLTACANHPKPTDASKATEARAVEFLKREVPAWSRENNCYSCHNNGDAARALFAARAQGYQIPSAALEDTVAWLTAPSNWNHNKGDPGFSDQRLADVQFAASLAAALESGTVKDAQAMKAAVIKVAKAQADDSSWPIDMPNTVRSPTTNRVTLATYMAWDSLRRISSLEISKARQKAEERLLAIKPDSVPNAAVLLLFMAKEVKGRAGSPLPAAYSNAHNGAHGVPRPTSLASSLEFLRRAQTRDGGWGPYEDSPPEAFDTALALLALAAFRTETGVPEMIRRGREFLIATQLKDGSWPATTRPSGGQSYAQQMSTSGWATLALLATR